MNYANHGYVIFLCFFSGWQLRTTWPSLLSEKMSYLTFLPKQGYQNLMANTVAFPPYSLALPLARNLTFTSTTTTLVTFSFQTLTIWDVNFLQIASLTYWPPLFSTHLILIIKCCQHCTQISTSTHKFEIIGIFFFFQTV